VAFDVHQWERYDDVKYVNDVTSPMQKKLTISIDEAVYEALHRKIGRGRISRFLEDLARPYVIPADMDAAYQQMAQDEEREQAAMEWAEGLVGDVSDEPR